ADLVHPVERLPARDHDFNALERLRNALDVAHFDEPGRSVSGRSRNEPGGVLLDTLVRLVHELDAILHENYESEPIAIGHFRGLCEAESLPEGDAWFDGVDDDDGSELLHCALLHGLHGWSCSVGFGFCTALRETKLFRDRPLVLEKWN